MQNLNKKTRSSLQSLLLPQELIEEEILSRLPVKSLLRFRCVSKPWASLIGSKRFIKTHLHINFIKNQFDCDRWKVILRCKIHGLNYGSSLHSYVNQPFVEPTNPIDDPKINDIMKDCTFVDYCNGLVCAYKKSGRVYLWNPVIRMSAKLPKINLGKFTKTKLGFGWDEQNNAYKVFVGMSKGNKRKGKIYSSKTNSWKAVSHGNLPRVYKGRFACGKLHWLVEDYIESFDLESEVFRKIELPRDTKGGVKIRLLWEYKHSFCLTYSHDGTQKLWSMKKYGVKESWVEESSIPSKINKFEGRCCKMAAVYIESLVSPLLVS